MRFEQSLHANNLIKLQMPKKELATPKPTEAKKENVQSAVSKNLD